MWKEQHLYGSSRVGLWQPEKSVLGGFFSSSPTTDGQGLRAYELTNHLGNVLATINDKGKVVSAQDYTPFGMTLTSRIFTVGSAYRFGFNGKEYDVAFKQQDYGMRIYRFNLGKFLSVDPLTGDYPELTPYQFANNSPIFLIDLDGAEGTAPARPGASRPANVSRPANSPSAPTARPTSRPNTTGGRAPSDNLAPPGANPVSPGSPPPPQTAPLLRPSTDSPGSVPQIAPAIAPIQADNTRLPAAQKVATKSPDPRWVCTNCYYIKGELYVKGAEGTAAHWECVDCDKTATIRSSNSPVAQNPDPPKIKIALGVQDDNELFNFAYSPKVQALPYTEWGQLGIHLPDQSAASFQAALMKLGNMPNVEFHFNLSVPGRGLVNDPVNLKSNASKVTTAEFLIIKTFFNHPDKTTFYYKSGTIYKPYNKKI